MPSAAIAATRDNASCTRARAGKAPPEMTMAASKGMHHALMPKLTVDSNIKFCCDPRRRCSGARLPCCSWLRHTIDSLLTPPRIRSGKNLFVTLLSTLGFLNRFGQIYIKSWGPGVQRPPAPRRSKLAPRSPRNKKQRCFFFGLYLSMVMYLFLFVLFYHRSGNEFHTNHADGPGCNDRQQRVVKNSRSSSPATTKPNKPSGL